MKQNSNPTLEALKTFGKFFLCSFLTLIIANGGLKSLDWIHAMESSLVASLPVIINFLNPNYQKYGVNKKEN